MRPWWRRIRSGFVCTLLTASLTTASDTSFKPILARRPTVNRDSIVFSYAGDLWSVSRAGGEAKRLTSGIGIETDPVFSPDGTQIAFTGEYDGNVDVYVMPAVGGIPRRLTYHPGADRVVGWTPDGRRVLFSSARHAYARGVVRLYTVSLEGGLPSELPLDRAVEGSYSPDGEHIAYVPIFQWQRAWKRYRGGQTKRIWIADLSDSSIQKIPRDNSNDFNPMWVGNTICFLSDRAGPVTLFAYDLGTHRVTRVVKNDGLDLKSASVGPGAIVYEQFGSIHLLDLESRQDRRVDIRIAADLNEVRPHFEKIEPKRIRSYGISPTGARALFAAHGEVLTVPAEKGAIRNLTRTPDVSEIDPAWSPDGNWIAYFSDESGEYALHVRSQDGLSEAKKISLGDPPSFYYSPTWSPNSRKIAYSDKRLNLWYVDLEKKTPVKIDVNTYAGPFQDPNPNWSPDSRWIAYNKELPNHLHAIFIYSLEQARSYQVTDGMSDALFPQFDQEGKYLYFTASTDVALSNGWLDMSSLRRPVTRSVYLAVLRKDLPSPLAPESDEEKAAQKNDGGQSEKHASEGGGKNKETAPVKVEIDFDNVSQRILSLPIPQRNYSSLIAGKAGMLYLVEAPVVDPLGGEGPPAQTLHRFDLKTRKTDKLLDGVTALSLSFNGEKVLYRQADKWFIRPSDKPAEPPPPPADPGPLKLDGMEVYVNPRAEWRHMFYQVWRDERDFFYDPGLHGLDIQAAEKRYAPYLDSVASRDDLNYLFEEMLGELTIGHMFVGGGDYPEVKKTNVGLLGADYSLENGRYRFARVYNGENWNPQLHAPLTQPGVNVVAGEYLLAVNGRELHASDNVYSFFEETVGKATVLTVGPNPDGSRSRQVTVMPVDDEFGLRNLAWVEGNRRQVDQMTGGRVAYVYLPDTADGGYTNFNRYYFAQVGKQAAIIDERFNGGGDIADYVIDYLRRPLLGYFTMREGTDITTPIEGIFGPKVMITNEMAGSGGDAMPWLFRRAGIGPLVGTRTWGGLVGHYTNPGDLIDGGFTGTPDLGFYSPDGAWEVENRGVQPDIEVEMDPKLIRQGHDPQLERAVAVVMEMLSKNPPPKGKRPAYPNYHTSDALGRHQVMAESHPGNK
jgi:tricorn protease